MMMNKSEQNEIIVNPYYDLVVSQFLKVRHQNWSALGRTYFRHHEYEPINDLSQLSNMLLRILEHPSTQRMIFDSRQFELFQTYKDSVDPDVLQIMPFESMWFEFGKSVPFSEIAFENMHMIGMYIGHTPNQKTVMPNLEQVVIYSKDYSPDAYLTHEHRRVVESGEYETYRHSDRHGSYTLHTFSFMYNSSLGMGFVRQSTLEGSDDEFPDASVVEHTPQTVVGAMPHDEPYIGAGTHGGYVGSLERTVIAFSRVIGWMLAFMTAKSIEIVEADLPRPIRRRALREGKTPRPWHIIQVQPKLINSNGSESGITHSYRYDVASHVRMQRRRLPDGSYRKTVEIVRAHQRGLKHLLYIPATRKYKE
jgi:hypothetical protein